MTNQFLQSSELLKRATHRTPGGVHSNVRLAAKPMPLFFERAEGSRLWDVDGNEYIDFVLGQGPMLLGHAHPSVIRAVKDALDDGQLFAGQHRREIELSEILCDVIPCAEVARFSTTGSEAVQAALRIARAATSRSRIVKFEGHYHGWLDNIYASAAPRVADTYPIQPVPESKGQDANALEDLVVLKWNDPSLVQQVLADGDVAAVILEPIAANNAVIPADLDFLRAVRDECSRAGTVLIFDEVISGFRVGLGGAQERLNVTPDLAVFGKAMANGFPISCVAGKASLFDGVADGSIVHAGTFNANVVSVAASLATVTTLREDPLVYSVVRDVGTKIMKGFEALADNGFVVQGFPELFWIGRGEGEVRTASDLCDFDLACVANLSGALAIEGIYTTGRGTWYASAAHSDEDAQVAVDAVQRCVASELAAATR